MGGMDYVSRIWNLSTFCKSDHVNGILLVTMAMAIMIS
jgi:hypothetical protein